MQLPPPIMEEDDIVEEQQLESLKYVETTIEHPMSHDNSKTPIIIEDQQASSQRVQFQ